MKKKLFVPFLLLCFYNVFAQKGKYSIPTIASYLPQIDSNSGETSNYLRDAFLPIGFSKDDKIAYLVEPADEARGCYFLEMCIKDLRTNNIVWQWKYVGDGSDSTDGLKKQWNTNYQLFETQLKKYRIQQQGNYSMQSFPIISKTVKYDFSLVVDSMDIPDWYRVIDKVHIIKSVNNKVVAEVATREHTSLIKEKESYRKFGGTLSCGLDYYMINPITKKPMLFYWHENLGWEGPPNIFTFEVIGVSL